MQGFRLKHVWCCLALALLLMPAAAWATPTEEDAKSAPDKETAKPSEDAKKTGDKAEPEAKASATPPRETGYRNSKGEVCEPSVKVGKVNTLEDLFSGGAHLLSPTASAPAKTAPVTIEWREVRPASPEPEPEG